MRSVDILRGKLKKIYWKFSKYKIINTKELYKYWEIIHLEKLLSLFEVDCIFDVGANYGQYAEMLREKVHYKGLIISFEPIPDAAEELRRKALGDDLWVVVELALGARDGEQLFNIMSDSEFSSLSSPSQIETNLFRNQNEVSQSIVVKTETLFTAYKRLKAIYKFERPFLKMDTQGYDVEIVKNAKSIMSEFIGLQSELAIKRIYDNAVEYQEALKVYSQCGFSLSAFVPNNAGHFPQLIETDCIMLRSDML